MIMETNLLIATFLTLSQNIFFKVSIYLISIYGETLFKAFTTTLNNNRFLRFQFLATLIVFKN